MTIDDEVDRIRQLSAPERMAGYIARSALLAEVGARLRKDGREEETWTPEEEAEWDRVGDDTEPWWYALTEQERTALVPIEHRLAALCRGETLEAFP